MPKGGQVQGQAGVFEKVVLEERDHNHEDSPPSAHQPCLSEEPHQSNAVNVPDGTEGVSPSSTLVPNHIGRIWHLPLCNSCESALLLCMPPCTPFWLQPPLNLDLTKIHSSVAEQERKGEWSGGCKLSGHITHPQQSLDFHWYISWVSFSVV